MRHRPLAAAALAGAGLLVAARPAAACEPLIPLALAMAGPAFIMVSLTGLAVAVAVKCAAYAAFERRFAWHKAVALMLAANVVSTIIGGIVAAFVAVPISGLLSLGVIYLATLIPAGRFLDECDWPAVSRLSAHGLAARVVVLVIISTMLFVLAQSTGGDPSALYWSLKLLFVLAAVTVSMVLTTVWEGGVIALLCGEPRRGYRGRPGFVRRRGRLDLRGLASPEPPPPIDGNAAMGLGLFTNVVRANLVTFAVVATIAAALTLPERAASPGWLINALVVLAL